MATSRFHPYLPWLAILATLGGIAAVGLSLIIISPLYAFAVRLIPNWPTSISDFGLFVPGMSLLFGAFISAPIALVSVILFQLISRLTGESLVLALVIGIATSYGVLLIYSGFQSEVILTADLWTHKIYAFLGLFGGTLFYICLVFLRRNADWLFD